MPEVRRNVEFANPVRDVRGSETISQKLESGKREMERESELAIAALFEKFPELQATFGSPTDERRTAENIAPQPVNNYPR